MRTALIACMLFTLAAPALAKDMVRGGVPATALTPEGLTLESVEPPLATGLPTRVTFVDAQGRAELVADVLIGADDGQARAALAAWKDKLSHADIPPLAIGDQAFGTDTAAGFAKDNVFIAVRRIRGTRLAPDVAAVMSARVAKAKAGSPVANRVTPTVGDLRENVPTVVGLPAGLLGARVSVTGPATIRRRGADWLVTRTGPGQIELSVVAVDALLRVTP